MAELSALDALLGAQPEITSTVHIKRLGVDFKVKSLTGEDVSKLREEATRYEIKGKERKSFVDENELGLAMVVAATIEPDFKDPKLLAHYGVSTANQCVNKALIAGELAQLTNAVVAVSGLGGNEEEIEAIKN